MSNSPLLRITQTRDSDKTDRFQVEVSFEAPDVVRQAVTCSVTFHLTDHQQEEIRWYLEDYLQFPQAPAPTIAQRIEENLADMGRGLFKAVFQANDDARDLWATLREHLNDTRIEVSTAVEDATAIPWELIRDPKTDIPLALRATAFVRLQTQTAQAPKLPQPAQEDEPLRILLVICRPRQGDDVPFRSVATRLLKGLTDESRSTFQLDLLRPATFARLGKVLRKAKDQGKPYHIVHFDGHGMYADLEAGKTASAWLSSLIPYLLGGPRKGSHGYLMFENPDHEHNVQPVDGPTLGSLLVETDVPVLILNACRSAHADPKQKPEDQAPDTQADVHGKIRALGSLAQEVMDAGIAGVVAMRYNVYVVTAAHLVADLYNGLVQGHSLGQAVTLGRKQLADHPAREIAYDPLPLQDWCVPIVYEAAPIRLFQSSKDKATLTLHLKKPQEIQNLDPKLPARPDAGFFGRDETLLALDRGFDTQSIVLLHALAGSGKTAVAAEFARWYVQTGGLQGGPVLFTSFETYTPLHSVLGHFGALFAPLLERFGINWSAITKTTEMRDEALNVLNQIPVLWIWDNVEPVTGFPKGAKSDWSEKEQAELVDFLREARDTKSKFLLTSRRDERAWLGDLPRRIEVPAMPLQERVQLARALADKQGQRFTAVADWRPLLEFTQGNPLTLTVLVGQALRDKLHSQEQIQAFVNQLRSGQAAFQDESSQGRSQSLGASLSYGFNAAFNEAERKILALLVFFQGFVQVAVLQTMGNPDEDWSLPALQQYDRDRLIALLDRAAEVGLLTAHGGGYYTIHPALPWFFREAFESCYPAESQRAALAPARAFVEAMGELGNYYHAQYGDGNRNVIAAISAEEANLLHARPLARSHGWWDAVTSTMQGLDELYDHTGRRAEWRRLVEQIVPEFVDPANNGPLPGRADQWSLVTQYRVRLARQERDWPAAQALQQVLVDWCRKQATTLLDRDLKTLTENERNTVRSLGVSISQLADIQREQGLAECVNNYQEDLRLAKHIGDQPGAAIDAFNLGHAYEEISSIRDLKQAESWYQQSLELRDPQDLLGRGKCMYQLGHVAIESFIKAQSEDANKNVLLRHINNALQYYHKALDMLPHNAINDLAVTHNGLGATYSYAGDIDKAQEHFRESIRYEERQGNLYGAGQTRYNVAIDMLQAGRLADALEYARAALANFKHFGNRAAADATDALELIADIEKAMQ